MKSLQIHFTTIPSGETFFTLLIGVSPFFLISAVYISIDGVAYIDLKRIYEEVSKYQDHHVFIDEFIFCREDMNETALENLCKLKSYLKETCLWLVLAGVIGPENEFPDNEYFRVGHFKDFYIPEMKLPLR